MAIGRSEDPDNPWNPAMRRHHFPVRDPIRVTHLGQRLSMPRAKAGHMTAIDQKPSSALHRPCEAGAVHIWVPAFAGTTKRSGKTVRLMRVSGAILVS